MLVPPLQNQDFQQRSEAVADLRNAESAKNAAAAERLHDVRRQKDQKQSESVVETHTPESDPDASKGEGGKGRRQSNKPPDVPEPLGGLKDAELRHRTDGGQFLDLHV